MEDDNAKAIRNIQVAEKVETAENNQMTRKRKRESSYEVPHQLTSIWERLKIAKVSFGGGGEEEERE